MIIRNVKIQDFKVIQALETSELGKDVNVYAHNYQGKSSFAKSIVFALEGVTETGSNRLDEIVRKGVEKTAVGVNVSFDGGKTFINVIREKNKKGTKLFIDRQKADQSDLDKFIGTKEHFLSAFIPGYFTRLTNDKAREIIMTIIKPPLREDVLKAIGTSANYINDLQLLDPSDELKETREQLKRNRDEFQRVLGQVEAFNQMLSKTVEEPEVFVSEELDKLVEQRAKSGSDTIELIARMKKELSDIRPRYDRLKSQLKKVTASEFQSGQPCPVCNHPMDEDGLSHVKFHFEAANAETEKKNSDITLELKSLIDKGNQLSEQIKSLETTVDPAEVEKINLRIQALQDEKSRILSHNAAVDALVNAQKDAKAKVEELNAKLDSLNADAAEMEYVIKALCEYRAKYAEMQLDQIKVHLNHASIELFQVVKSTGELKPAFNVTYKGIPFNELSDSEKIRCNLEFATMINKITERDYPVYIDNAESICEYDRPFATQVFTATVKKDAPLTIENVGA